MMFRKKILGIFFLLCPLAFLFLVPFLEPLLSNSPFYGKKYDQEAFNFHLKTTQDKVISLHDFKNNYLYLFFGYTHCYTTCSNAMFCLYELSKQIKRNNVKFLFISIDPERDTRDRLNTYIKSFGDHFIALYGNHRMTREVVRKYYAYYAKELFSKDNHYDLHHTSFIYLITPQSKLKLIYMQNYPDARKMFNDFKLLNLKKRLDYE